MTVQANESIPLGGMLCLSYWRDGRCGVEFPHTWRFLLKTVKDSPTFGPLVAETIEKKAYSETSWSVLPVQLPGPSTLKVRLTTDPLLIETPSLESYTVKTLVEIFHYYWWINELHASSHAWCATTTEGDQLITFNSKILPFRTHSDPILYSFHK